MSPCDERNWYQAAEEDGVCYTFSEDYETRARYKVSKSSNSAFIQTAVVYFRRAIANNASNRHIPPVPSTCPLHTNNGCGKERRILIGPW